MRRLIAKLLMSMLVGIAFNQPNEGLADVGERLISVRCNGKSGAFEVQPFIAWNDDIKGFGRAIENGLQVTNSRYIYSLKSLRNGLDVTCSVAGNTLRVVVRDRWNPVLQLFQGTSRIARPTISDVWQFHGPVYRVRYTKEGKWQEMCGGEGQAIVWVELDRARDTTDCRPYTEVQQRVPADAPEAARR
jgi:hypothetical protein